MTIWRQCQTEKIGKPSFKRKNFNTKEVLELVRTYLHGPMGTEIYSGDKYYIFFVDDYSTMMTVMYLEDKFEDF